MTSQECVIDHAHLGSVLHTVCVCVQNLDLSSPKPKKTTNSQVMLRCAALEAHLLHHLPDNRGQKNKTKYKTQALANRQT